MFKSLVKLQIYYSIIAMGVLSYYLNGVRAIMWILLPYFLLEVAIYITVRRRRKQYDKHMFIAMKSLRDSMEQELARRDAQSEEGYDE